jgi:hypothetical protein
VLPQSLTDDAQRLYASVGRFRDRTLHVEMEFRFRVAGTLLSQSSPAGVAYTRRAIASTVADKIDTGVHVGRPVALELLQKCRPVAY